MKKESSVDNKQINKIMIIVLIVALSMFAVVMIFMTADKPFAPDLPKEVKNCKKAVVEFDIEKRGTFRLELRNDLMPKTTEVFLKRVNSKYYDKKTFYRADRYMLVAGSESNTDGVDFTYGFDFENNPDIKYKKYSIAMAKNNNSGKSSTAIFFISKSVDTDFEKEYAVFGQAYDVKSENVIDTILQDDVINSARIIMLDGEKYESSVEAN